MRFDLGDRLVYGGRVAEIVATQMGTIAGREQGFLVLRAGEGPLERVLVPLDRAPSLCRAIIDRDRADRLLAALAEGPAARGEQRTWREAKRALEVGDPEGLVAALRSYAAMVAERELTGGELAQVLDARERLTREIALALDVAEETIAPRVEAVVPL